MVTLVLTPPPAALGRFARNCDAAGLTLPRPDLHFCPGRDGSLTALRDGHWLAGCSVPRRAAEVMLRKENWPGRSLCLLAPTHGQQIAATLDKLGSTRALVVAVRDAADLADLLACCDVADDLKTGRLTLAWDAASLRSVFDRHRGLAVPQQMVRLPDADPAAATAVAGWVHPALSALGLDHARRLAAVRPAAAATGRCVLVGRHFRLWSDAGESLARVLGETAGVTVFDTDRPADAADAAAAEAVAAAAVVIADRSRPTWATADRPWLTWMTKPNVPPFDAARATDGLLLADAVWQPLARAAGWPDDRIVVAGWPAFPIHQTPGAPPAMIFDLPNLDAPADIADATGPRLVWEAIREELARDPFAVGPDAVRYVERAPARLGLAAIADFLVRRIVDTLVAPAVALGMARWLAGQGVAFTLHGSGWSDELTLADHVRGPVMSREMFCAAVAASGGLIDVGLPGTGDVIRSAGVPVTATFGRTAQRIVQDLAAMRAGRIHAVPVAAPITQAVIESLLSQLKPKLATGIHR